VRFSHGPPTVRQDWEEKDGPKLPLVDVAEHIAALRKEGELLAAAAAETDLDIPIPTCPDWRMRDLVRHIGDVHRWATAHVAERRSEPIGRRELAEVAGPLPDDAGLLAWFREGHGRLVRTLEEADPETECWSFLPASSSVAFWARRQAHETGIHRADAESPGGPDRITPFPQDFAVDGIEEFLFGFLSRSDSNERPNPPRTLAVHATDAAADWLVRLGEEAEASRGDREADCSVRGRASDLHLLLWNRLTPERVDVQGDPSVLGLWKNVMRVHWSRSR
jgi:uncharacterized protein (TIGR03083 family)